jgi:5-methyltetrahydrofolate--homocysteine methyltransferase
VLYRDESRREELMRFPTLRQQAAKTEDKPHLALADFVAPRGEAPDHIGAFAVTAGLGADELSARYARVGDDYSSIIVKALADRLAEAFAEMLHQRARRDWGYGASEDLSLGDLDRRELPRHPAGVRLPACPDHSEKVRLFELLGAEEAGLSLTETCAMWPAASVSGLYFAHPEARYFLLGGSIATRSPITRREKAWVRGGGTMVGPEPGLRARLIQGDHLKLPVSGKLARRC